MTSNLPPDRASVPLPSAEELWGADAPAVAEDAAATDPGDEPTFRMDSTIRGLARDAYPSPDMIPRDAMWEAIQSRRAGSDDVAHRNNGSASHRPFLVQALPSARAARRWQRAGGLLAAIAATLVVGVAIGRSTSAFGDRRGTSVEAADVAGESVASAEGVSGREGPAGGAAADARLLPLLSQLTSEHWSQSEALLLTAAAGTADAPAGTGAMVASWARDLLATTRLLLDTESLTDNRTRQLLQDLELTLALIVQAQASGRPSDLQAVREDLTAGDLLLRVRGAGMPADPTSYNSQGVFE